MMRTPREITLRALFHNSFLEELMSDQTRFQLNETDLPKFWYNIYADSPVPPTLQG
jgi:hypothetical protein